jgi:DNA-directed RNA polymerase subunit alpha
MRIRWRNLELPSRIIKDESSAGPTYGKFVIEPFERGFGTTVGNSLRRILLSSLEGCAVSMVKIKGARHEFTSLEGVLEDVTEIVLNVKSLIVALKPYIDEPKRMRVGREKPGPVTAADIQADPAIEIRNPELVLATLTDKVNFEMEMEVRRGRGYVNALEFVTEETEIGTIPLDAVFSPVTRVRYSTEDTRVGQKTNYDRLVMEIWTNGTVAPETALVEAAKILRKHLNPFVQYAQPGEPVEAGEAAVPAAAVGAPVPGLPPELEQKLNTTIQQLDLSVRATNCLESVDIQTVRRLVEKTEDDLLKIRSFGRTSLREVVRKLESIGLRLGMTEEDLRELGKAAAPASS